jgi:hypothetical protein
MSEMNYEILLFYFILKRTDGTIKDGGSFFRMEIKRARAEWRRVALISVG